MTNQIVTTGTISDLTLDPGDSLTVNAGGTADTILVDGGLETSYGEAKATTLRQGGTLMVAGGTADHTIIGTGGDAVIEYGGFASATTVQAGGTFAVLDGGSAGDLTIEDGGVAYLDDGSSATDVHVNDGGVVLISALLAPTIVHHLTLDSGGAAIILPGSDTVTGITGPGSVVSTGVALLGPNASLITHGSTVVALDLASGISEYVLPGGTVYGGTVAAGASEMVFQDGSAEAVVLRDSFQTVNDGASVSNIVVDHGAEQFVYAGGLASGTIVNSGGVVAVNAGGTGIGIIVNDGGIDVVDGVVLNTVVNSGGQEDIVFDGSSTNTTINDGGAVYVFGTAIATRIGSGGYEVVEGTAINPIVGDGGMLLNGYPIDNTNPPSTGEVTGAMVTAGGIDVVFGGSVDSDTTVESGGTYIALPGAFVSGLTANAGAVIVTSGIVLFQPVASIALLGSSVTGLTLASGMSNWVLNDAVETGIVVGNGAFSQIGAGGLATNSTIEGGGTLSFAPGGGASGTIAFAGIGGTLDIQGETLGGVTVMNFLAGDTIDFDAVTGKTSTATLLSGNTLQVTNGTVIVDLQLDPQQDFSTSTIAIDATNHGASVTITQSPTAASPPSPTTGTGVVPVDIPLYVVPFGDGYKIGIEVSLNGGASYRMYEFDTGGTGFYAAYSPGVVSDYTVVSPTPTSNSYTSGNNYVAQVVSTNVTFQTTTGGTISVNNADIGLITAAEDPGTFTSQQWNSALTDTPSTPPLQGSFYGDFGMSLHEGLGLNAILPQVGDGLSDGFIVTVGNYPYGENGQIGSVQVGLTQEDIASFPTVISMHGLNLLDPFPNSGQPTYAEGQSTGTMTLLNGTTSFSAVVNFVFDTGTPTMRIYASAEELAPFQDPNTGEFYSTTTITNTAPSAFAGVSAWALSFAQGSDRGLNMAVSSTSSTPMNTVGLNPFFGYRVMFDLADGLMGFDPIPCFAEGTRLRTDRGAVAVEALRVGDRLVAIDGKAKPIVWIGRRSVDCGRHPAPQEVWPVRVRAHTFGPGLPQRDVLLSPDHAVFMEDVLIPVKYLLNGSTIAQVRRARVRYYHVELARHDVVLADGLPVETYLDTGGKSAFEDSGTVIQAHPVFASGGVEPSLQWEAFGYAPLTVTGPVLERVRRRARPHRRRVDGGRRSAIS